MTKNVLVIDTANEYEFMFKQLRLPIQFSHVAQALCYWYAHSYEKSINEWLLANNVDTAYSIFFDKIMPLYFHKDASVKLSRALQA